MKLTNYLETNNVFDAINAQHPFPFITGREEALQVLLDVEYGHRTLLPKLEGMEVDVLAQVLVLRYASKWEGLVSDAVSELSIVARDSDVETETIDTEETRTSSKEDIMKVSAFDSEELIDNEGGSSDGEEGLTGNRHRVLKREKQDIETAFANLNLLEKNNIIKVVLNDISSFMTLSIY